MGARSGALGGGGGGVTRPRRAVEPGGGLERIRGGRPRPKDRRGSSAATDPGPEVLHVAPDVDRVVGDPFEVAVDQDERGAGARAQRAVGNPPDELPEDRLVEPVDLVVVGLDTP